MKYDYKLVEVESMLSGKKTLEKLNQELRVYGEAGWELVNFQALTLDASFVFVFKKPRDDSF